MSKEKVFVAGKEYLKSSESPSVSVWGETIPEAWETAVMATLEYGTNIPTEYDQEIDPDSRDITLMLTIADPLKEPRIHKALPCGLQDLAIYVREVVDGIGDDKVKEGGWSYSYHDRLANWPGVDGWDRIDSLRDLEFELPHINQLDKTVEKLAETPHSRRAQAITWYPFGDATHHEPPCLQRVWCRVVRSNEEKYLLDMNTHWRSRDAFKAAFMNIFALTELQNEMSKKISDLSGKKVAPGRYIDISDSFHIYGQYLRKGELDSFKRSIEKRAFEDRVYKTSDPIVESFFNEVYERDN